MSGRSFEEESNLEKCYYLSDAYFSDAQKEILFLQLRLLLDLKPKSILEIGIGNGFVSSFLKSCDYKVTTFDINPNLNPDVVGSITELDKFFKDKQFDVILCAEVLEHIPFTYFVSSLKKISKISNKAIITLPSLHNNIFDITITLRLPYINRNKRFGLTIPAKTRKKSDLHHWEIGEKGIYINDVKKIFERYFNIIKHGRLKIVPYINYFSLISK